MNKKNMKKNTRPKSPLGYFVYLWPVLLLPLSYLPYKTWGIQPFAEFARRLQYGGEDNPFWALFNWRVTVIWFWLALSALVMLAGVIISARKVRPWYIIPPYLIVLGSLCGVFSLILFNLTI